MRSVAVQFVSEPVNCHGAGFILGAGARVWVQNVERIYMASRAGMMIKDQKKKERSGP
jgi:hypothetical protein